MHAVLLLLRLAGGSDGGVHAWKLTQLHAAVAALGDAKQSAAAAAALSLVPMPGHAAAVLGLDYCSARHQLASASEVSGRCCWGHIPYGMYCCCTMLAWLNQPGLCSHASLMIRDV